MLQTEIEDILFVSRRVGMVHDIGVELLHRLLASPQTQHHVAGALILHCAFHENPETGVQRSHVTLC